MRWVHFNVHDMIPLSANHAQNFVHDTADALDVLQHSYCRTGCSKQLQNCKQRLGRFLFHELCLVMQHGIRFAWKAGNINVHPR